MPRRSSVTLKSGNKIPHNRTISSIRGGGLSRKQILRGSANALFNPENTANPGTNNFLTGLVMLSIAIVTGVFTGYVASRPIFGPKIELLFQDEEIWRDVHYPEGYIEEETEISN
jgi:hypothetical protein